MHLFNQSTRRPTASHPPSSSSISSSIPSSPSTQPRPDITPVTTSFPSTFPILTNSPSSLNCLILAIGVCSSFTVSIAAPLTHNLPSEAAEQMEGLLRYLPVPLQAAMSSSTGFTPAFLQSLLLILACEMGDRTFFVAAILAMKSSRVVVWCGALTALAAMTVLSSAIGKAFPMLLNKRWTSMAAAALFLFFGIQLLRDWWRMRNEDDAENDELAEVEEELRQSGADDKKAASTAMRSRSFGSLSLAMFSPVFAKALSMTALAEWGDRSQIATIALAASRDMTGVIAGGILGHAICTGLAVVGGRLLASSISERAVAFMGGVLFVSFAALTVSGVLD